eukprot:916852-Rhodomonas_salina.1
MRADVLCWLDVEGGLSAGQVQPPSLSPSPSLFLSLPPSPSLSLSLSLSLVSLLARTGCAAAGAAARGGVRSWQRGRGDGGSGAQDHVRQMAEGVEKAFVAVIFLS